MKISEMFPSNYLKAADMKDKGPIKLTIASVTLETMPDGATKPVATFRGTDKKLVMNKTNCNLVSELYGDDTNDWIGKELELYPARVEMKGEVVDAIRVLLPDNKSPF